jgi:hypothetical protein
LTTEYSTLKEAHNLVYGARGDLYANPTEDYTRTVAIFEQLSGIKMTPEDGILFMLAVKMSRLAHAHQNNFPSAKRYDTIVDGEGYLDCYWQVITRKEEQCQQPNESPTQYEMQNGVLTPLTASYDQQSKDTQQSGLQQAQHLTAFSRGNQSKVQQ